MIIDTRKIKELLQDDSITNSQIAKASGLSNTAIANYRRDLDLDSLKLKTAHALQQTFDRLINKDNSFNLLTEPWIMVHDGTEEKEVSIIDLFQNAKKYRFLAGESEPQNLVILRLLLAIVQRVYQGEKATDVFEHGFDKRLYDYLESQMDAFDFFGNHPFYQVIPPVFNAFVDIAKNIRPGKKSGTIKVRQLNRLISESNNSPALFSPKSEKFKDELELSELIRWVITYQNYAGSSDKTKLIQYPKDPVSAGWLYTIDPVYVAGENLFDTLVLNMVEDSNEQKPFWECEISEYVDQANQPIDNIAQLYTTPARLISIVWENSEPTVYVAGFPAQSTPSVVDPMGIIATNKDGEKYYARKSLDNYYDSLILKLGTLVTNKSIGVITGLNRFKNVLPSDYRLKIINITYVNDGTAAKAPVVASDNVIYTNLNQLIADKDKSTLQQTSVTAGKMIDAFKFLITNIEKSRHSTVNRKAIKDAVYPLNYNLANLLNNWLEYGIPNNWQDILTTTVLNFADDRIVLTPRDMRFEQENNPRTVHDMFGIFRAQVYKARKEAVVTK